MTGSAMMNEPVVVPLLSMIALMSLGATYLSAYVAIKTASKIATFASWLSGAFTVAISPMILIAAFG